MHDRPESNRARVKRWREENREKYNEYMRNLRNTAKYRAKAREADRKKRQAEDV